MTDIAETARLAYEFGVAPLDFAEQQIATLIEVAALVATARDTSPESFPEFAADLTIPALASRILGALLDAGWQPPVYPIPEPGGHRA